MSGNEEMMPPSERSSRLSDTSSSEYQARAQQQQARQETVEQRRRRLAQELGVPVSEVEARQLDERGEEVGVVPTESAIEEVTNEIAGESRFLQPGDVDVDADPREGVEVNVDEEAAAQRQAESFLDQIADPLLTEAGRRAAVRVADNQEVNYRIVLNDALERSGAEDVSPRTDDPADVIAALDPDALEASIETFGEDDPQTGPFRSLPGQLREVEEQVEQERQQAEENPQQFLTELEGELPEINESAQQLAETQALSRTQFRAEREARNEISEQYEGIDYWDVEADANLQSGEVDVAIDEEAAADYREQSRRIVVDGDELAPPEAREEIASSFEDVGADAVAFEQTESGLQTLIDDQTVSEFQQTQIAQDVGVPESAVDRRDDEFFVERDEFEEALAEDAGEDVAPDDILLEGIGEVDEIAVSDFDEIDAQIVREATEEDAVGIRLTPGPEATRVANERALDDVESGGSPPGPVATGVGVAASTLAETPLGDVLGGVADVGFGTDSDDRGLAGGARDAADDAAQWYETQITDPMRSSEGGRTEPVAPGVGGLEAASNTEFVQDSSVVAAETLNPGAFARDAIDVTSVGVQAADLVADEGAEGAQVVGEAAAAGVEALPGVVIDVAETARENPQDAAEFATGLGTSAVVGGAAFRGVRSAGSGARRVARRIDLQLGEFRRANRGQGQFGRQRDRDNDNIVEMDFESPRQRGDSVEADGDQLQLVREETVDEDLRSVRDGDSGTVDSPTDDLRTQSGETQIRQRDLEPSEQALQQAERALQDAESRLDRPDLDVEQALTRQEARLRARDRLPPESAYQSRSAYQREVNRLTDRIQSQSQPPAAEAAAGVAAASGAILDAPPETELLATEELATDAQADASQGMELLATEELMTEAQTDTSQGTELLAGEALATDAQTDTTQGTELLAAQELAAEQQVDADLDAGLTAATDSLTASQALTDLDSMASTLGRDIAATSTSGTTGTGGPTVADPVGRTGRPTRANRVTRGNRTSRRPRPRKPDFPDFDGDDDEEEWQGFGTDEALFQFEVDSLTEVDNDIEAIFDG
ncbi:hypothetical protein ACOJIV_20595 [Haloarcula sp. AONF1]